MCNCVPMEAGEVILCVTALRQGLELNWKLIALIRLASQCVLGICLSISGLTGTCLTFYVCNGESDLDSCPCTVSGFGKKSKILRLELGEA